MDRRSFLKTCGVASSAIAWGEEGIFTGANDDSFNSIGLHPFLEAHPEAVFIRRTKVSSKDDIAGKKREAQELFQKIFTAKKDSGIPLSGKVAFKPNLTSTKNTGLTHGIVTDPYVVEGFVESLKARQMDPQKIYLREGLNAEQPVTGFSEMARRCGVHYGDEVDRMSTTMECPDGVVFRRTKFLGPFGYEESRLINVSKMKTHSMGLTLCVKNLQGTNIQPYIRFCSGLQKNILDDFQPDAQAHVDALFAKHQKAGLHRWDTEKAAWMEMWIHRTIDSYSLIKPKVLLNIIEGIYSQNGDGFDGGPGKDGAPDIFMTNLLIFGRDAFRTDIIGHWIGGHEPGNFGLFHVAKERGVSDALDPRNIPIYLWEDSGPKLITLEDLPRTAMQTPYLPKDGEVKFHMIDEAFSYPTEKRLPPLAGGSQPMLRVLGTNRPDPGSRSLILEFQLSEDGPARVEIRNRHGEIVGQRNFTHLRQGIHMTEWNTFGVPAGSYLGRLSTSNFQRAARFNLVA